LKHSVYILLKTCLNQIFEQVLNGTSMNVLVLISGRPDGATENASRDLTTRHQIKHRCTFFMLHAILYERHLSHSLCNSLLRDLCVYFTITITKVNSL